MRNIRVRQGSQVPLLVYQGDEGSVSATLILKNQETSDIIEKTGDFELVDGGMVADLTLDAVDTAVVGLYDYQINENFDDADPIKYPDAGDCDGDDCSFPTIEICESLDEEIS